MNYQLNKLQSLLFKYDYDLLMDLTKLYNIVVTVHGTRIHFATVVSS